MPRLKFYWIAWRFFAGYPVRRRIPAYIGALRYVWQHRHDHDDCPVCAAERQARHG